MGYEYSIDASERPSEGVVTAMARHATCSPLELKPLGSAIDPDALDRLLDSGSGAEVRFRCCGAEFTVTEDEVQIEDATDPTETA